MEKSEVYISFFIRKKTEWVPLGATMYVESDNGIIDNDTIEMIGEALKERYGVKELTIMNVVELPIRLTRREK